MRESLAGRNLCLFVVACALWGGRCTSVSAEYIYSLTSSQSELDLIATGNSLGGELVVTEQNANARTRYQGTIGANFHSGFGANSRISFPNTGSANAINPTGLFNLPLQYNPNIGGGAGSAPANYGVNLVAPTNIVLPPLDIPDFGTIDLGTISQVTFRLALRDLQLGVSSSSRLPIDPISRQFDASLLAINVNQGFADVNGSLRLSQSSFTNFLAVGAALLALQASVPDLGLTIQTNFLSLSYDVGFGTRLDLAGTSVANQAETFGTVTYNELTEFSQLTIPVLADFGTLDFLLGTVNLKFQGQLRGSATIPNIFHVPEPSSLALVGLVSFTGLIRRRKAIA
jgi:hypothetical protein